MKKILLSIAMCFFLVLSVNAQYWSLSGNNATNSHKLGTKNSTHLKLYTNNFERLRITSSGNVGIGTTNPSSNTKLHVYNNSNGGYGVWGYGRYLGVYGESNSYGSYGVYGYSRGSNGYGVYGYGTYGVWGKGKTCDDYGVYGEGGKYGVYGYSECDDSYGVYGYNNNSSGYGLYCESEYIGGYGKGSSYGLYGYTPGGSGSNPYYPAGVYGYNSSTGYGTGGYCEDGYGVFGYSPNGFGVVGWSPSNYAGYFFGDVYTSGSYVASDRILKKDITHLKSAIDLIKQLHPTTYDYKQDGRYKLMNLPKGKHFGLISDEVERVLPNLVKSTKVNTRMLTANLVKPGSKTNQNSQAEPGEVIDYKAINYTELIPVLVAGMQEQQTTIELLNVKIEALTQLVNQLQKSNSGASVKLLGMLGDAQPNPVEANTRVTYSLPDNVSRAEMIISSINGQKIKQMYLDKSGKVDINTSNLASGTYTYSLVVAGRVVATKELVVRR